MTKKRFVGRSSESLADGLVVFPGDIADLTSKEWADNAHLADQFIDAEEAAPDAPAAAPKRAKTDSTKE